jgi:hypothetical protein
VVLQGYSTEDISLDPVPAELSQPIPYGSIRIQYSGKPGSLMAEVASVDQSKDLVVDAKLQNEGNGWAGSGANPWHLDSETDSLVFLTDMGDQPVRIGFKVWAKGTVYYLTRLDIFGIRSPPSAGLPVGVAHGYVTSALSGRKARGPKVQPWSAVACYRFRSGQLAGRRTAQSVFGGGPRASSRDQRRQLRCRTPRRAPPANVKTLHFSSSSWTRASCTSAPLSCFS